MKNICITSFAKGYNFNRGLTRLEKMVQTTVKVPFLGFTEYPVNCPTHEEVPYAFKYFCIDECKKMGYDGVLWLDACIIIKNNLTTIFQIMDKYGYFFIKNWHSMGQYTHDKCLQVFNITREDSFFIPCVQGTNFGLNFNFENSCVYHQRMLEYAKEGTTFKGSFDNTKQQCSKDPRVSGHRGDQSAMSIVAQQLAMVNWCATEEHAWFIHDRKFVKDVPTTLHNDVYMSI